LDDFLLLVLLEKLLAVCYVVSNISVERSELVNYSRYAVTQLVTHKQSYNGQIIGSSQPGFWSRHVGLGLSPKALWASSHVGPPHLIERRLCGKPVGCGVSPAEVLLPTGRRGIADNQLQVIDRFA
jgi:hypothetical protein